MIGLFSRSIYPRQGASAVVTEELASCFTRGDMVVIGGRKLFRTPVQRSDTSVEVLTLGSEINIKGRADRFFEPFRWLLFPFHLRRAISFCRRHGCDRIIATFPDELFLLLGLIVAKRLQLPFYPYLHNTIVENRTGWRKLLAAYVQKRAFSQAVRVLVISEGMARFYRSKYHGVQICTVPHVFADYPELDLKKSAVEDKVIRTVALCGNFNQTNIDATRRVINALHQTGEYKIILYTPVPALLLRMRGIEVDKISSIEYVSKADFMRCLANADLLVLTHGLTGGLSDIEYQTIFPTRTISLLLAGRPLLVHAPQYSFLADFIRGSRCGVVVDQPDECALQRAAHALTHDEALAHSVTTQAAKVAKMFHGPVVKAGLIEAIG